MKALIFAAGLGTRFKPWTDRNPKALAIVNGKSLLQRNIEYLQQWGITEVVVNVHHFADQIIDAINQNKGWGSHVLISDERDEVLETGGGLLKAKSLLNGASFLTINVDILTDLNINHLLSFHQEQQSFITLATTRRTTSRYLLFDKDDRLCGWHNTSTGAERIAFHTNEIFEKAYSGVAVFEPTIFERLTQTGKFSLIDVYLDLAANNKIVSYDHSDSKLLDVGKPDSVAIAEKLFF